MISAAYEREEDSRKAAHVTDDPRKSPKTQGSGTLFAWRVTQRRREIM